MVTLYPQRLTPPMPAGYALSLHVSVGPNIAFMWQDQDADSSEHDRLSQAASAKASQIARFKACINKHRQYVFFESVAFVAKPCNARHVPSGNRWRSAQSHEHGSDCY